MSMSAAVMDQATEVIRGLQTQLEAREALIADLRQVIAQLRDDLADQGAQLARMRARVARANATATREQVAS